MTSTSELYIEHYDEMLVLGDEIKSRDSRIAELEAQKKRLFVEELCDMFPNGWSHEDALITYYTTRDDKQSDSGHDLIYYIRDEATKTNGILKEKDGNYILRSK